MKQAMDGRVLNIQEPELIDQEFSTPNPAYKWYHYAVLAAFVLAGALGIIYSGTEINRRVDALKTSNNQEITWIVAHLDNDLNALHHSLIVAAPGSLALELPSDRPAPVAATSAHGSHDHSHDHGDIHTNGTSDFEARAFSPLIKAFNHPETHDDSVFKNVRAQYIALNGHLHELLRNPEYSALLLVPGAPETLTHTLDQLESALPYVHGSDVILRKNLQQVNAVVNSVQQQIQRLNTITLSHAAIQNEAERVAVSNTMLRLSVLMVGLIALLVGVAIRLIQLNRRMEATAEEAASTSRRLASTVEASLDAILVVNDKGIVMDFNKSGEKLFGYTKQEALGQSMVDLFFPENLIEPSLRSIRRFLETGDQRVIGGGRLQLVAQRKCGNNFPIEFSIGKAERKNGRLYIAFIRDISDQLQAETQLMSARDKALDGEKAKSRFLAVMSHEMRTPLNGLLGTLDLLAHTSLSAKQRQFLTISQKSGLLLLDHVNDVLDISKIEADKLVLENRPFNPEALLKEVCDGQRSLARSRGNTLSFAHGAAPLGTIVGDKGRLRQVLLNLISNANKFTKDGTITVEAEELNDEQGTIEFRIADTGIGISADNIEVIFTDFVTLDQTFEREAEGTGLGLAIVRRLVTAMGGEVGVESEPDEGSLFWFRVPFGQALLDSEDEVLSGETLKVAEADKSPDRPLEILLVEDNQINRFVAREMLESDGHKVTEAEDGEEGAQAAVMCRFDVILMDISMPRLDGVAATKMIRASGGPNAKTPIIALTAHALPDDIARFKEAGMDQTLAKPVVRTELNAVLHQSAQANAPDSDAARAAAPNVPEVVETPLINEEILAQLVDILGETRVGELFERFIAEADEAIAQLVEVQGAEGVQDAIPEVHRLAGSASTFGAQRLQIALRDLETKGHSGETDAFLDDVPELPAILAASQGALQSAIAAS